ncbi:hypothetical protein LTR16_007412, partial [Cryomyces antarcticus]
RRPCSRRRRQRRPLHRDAAHDAHRPAHQRPLPLPIAVAVAVAIQRRLLTARIATPALALAIPVAAPAGPAGHRARPPQPLPERAGPADRHAAVRQRRRGRGGAGGGGERQGRKRGVRGGRGQSGARGAERAESHHVQRRGRVQDL